MMMVGRLGRCRMVVVPTGRGRGWSVRGSSSVATGRSITAGSARRWSVLGPVPLGHVRRTGENRIRWTVERGRWPRRVRIETGRVHRVQESGMMLLVLVRSYRERMEGPIPAAVRGELLIAGTPGRQLRLLRWRRCRDANCRVDDHGSGRVDSGASLVIPLASCVQH